MSISLEFNTLLYTIISATSAPGLNAVLTVPPDNTGEPNEIPLNPAVVFPVICVVNVDALLFN